MGMVSIRQSDPVTGNDVERPRSTGGLRPTPTLLAQLASVAQLDRAAGFYPAGSGFESWRGRSSATVRSILRTLVSLLRRGAATKGEIMVLAATDPMLTTSVSTSSSGPSGALIALIVVFVVLHILGIIGYWKSLTKGGESGAWSLLFFVTCLYPLAFLPMTKLVGRPQWWALLLYVPIVNIVIMAILSIDIAKSYGRSTGFGVGLWLLGPIFYLILGFGPATYRAPAVTAGA